MKRQDLETLSVKGHISEEEIKKISGEMHRDIYSFLLSGLVIVGGAIYLAKHPEIIEAIKNFYFN